MQNDEEEERTRGYVTFVIRHSSFVIAPRSSHVDRWRCPSCDRAVAFDRLHGDADFREEQYAMVRATVAPRRDQSVSRSRAAEGIARRFRPRQLSDQSRRDQSAVPREFASGAFGGTRSRGSTRTSLSGDAPGRASRRRRGSRSGKDRRVTGRDLGGDPKGENENRVGDDGWSG